MIAVFPLMSEMQIIHLIRGENIFFCDLINHIFLIKMFIDPSEDGKIFKLMVKLLVFNSK